MQRRPEDPRPEPPAKPLVLDPRRAAYRPPSWIAALQMTSNRASDDFKGCVE